MLRKLKKVFPAVVSAILCVTMLLGITASAASAWSDTKALTIVKYNSNYIKWAEKYSKKETKNTIAYSKSRTKKILDKITREMSADKCEYSLGMASKDRIVGIACKGENFKLALFENEGMAFYITGDTVTFLSVDEKEIASLSAGEEYKETISDMVKEQSSTFAEIFNFDISENTTGKIFKFKSNDKIYYYEEFKFDEYGNMGFLFTEKGTLLAMINSGSAFCINFKTSVDDSEFDIPKGYKTVDYDDFEY